MWLIGCVSADLSYSVRQRLEGGLRCAQCTKFQIPPFICSPGRVTDFQPSEKCTSPVSHMQDRVQVDLDTGKNATYKNIFTGVIPVRSKPQRAAELVHYAQGPVLKVSCSEFVPTYDHQVRALMKDGSGWHAATTTAFCLADEVDIASHVKASVCLVLDEARNSEHASSFIFKLVWFYRDASTTPDFPRLTTWRC